MEPIDEMAAALLESNVDLGDDEAVVLALIDAGFTTSQINTWSNDAIEEARAALASSNYSDALFDKRPA